MNMQYSIPFYFLKLESLVIAILSIYLYAYEGWRWSIFFLLWLIPDVGMIGYAINLKVGAVTYNLMHTYIGPLLLIIISLLIKEDNFLFIAIIWISHISIDRLLGYGLKYQSGFKNTTEQLLSQHNL